MFSVKVNEEKNRIYITLGEMGTGEGEQLVNDLKEKLTKLKKGFTGISDIRNYAITDPSESFWADRALKVVTEAGMVRAVRVTGSVTHDKETKEKLGYVVSLAASIEEADKVLDEYQS